MCWESFVTRADYQAATARLGNLDGQLALWQRRHQFFFDYINGINAAIARLGTIEV
jgi:hypothetical protein